MAAGQRSGDSRGRPVTTLDKLVADTCALVEIDSRNAEGESAIVEWVRARVGPDSRLVLAAHPVAPDRQNLQITLPGKCSEHRLHLLAHLDTVPVSGHWDADPWCPRVEDGQIWGLGAADMKSGLAVALNVLLDLADDQDFEPEHDLVLWLTADEESSSMSGAVQIGSQGLVNKHESVLALEPTGLRLRQAQAGVRWMRITVEGRSAHAGRRHLGVDANLALARVVTGLVDAVDALAHVDPDLGRVLFNPGCLSGGESANVVSGRAVAEVDFRLVPPVDDHAILTLVRSVCDAVIAETPGLEIQLEPLGPARPPNRVDPDCELVRLLSSSFEAVTGTRLESGGADGHEAYTDASMIAALVGSRNCTVFGPGSSDRAHVPNECVPVNDLEIAYATVRAVCRDWSPTSPRVAV